MKQWIKKLTGQFDVESDISEDRATLLYLIDLFSRNLIEVDARPVRKVREIFDEFAKGLANPNSPHSEKLLFRFRQFFAAYRIQEYAYIQKTFEDFKTIIWDFADQLNDSVVVEQDRDQLVRASLDELREAVEANSIDDLKNKSREFIDFYIELQSKNDSHRTKRLEAVKKHLDTVKKKLIEIHQEARRDHLTGAFNRRSFDEKLTSTIKHCQKSDEPAYLLALDIDYFKKINDVFGHDAGDQVLKHLVTYLNHHFAAHHGFVARVGGEEFSVLLPGSSATEVQGLVESLLIGIRKEVLIHSDTQIRFTVSVGIAPHEDNEPAERWLKRADRALYRAKESGRDQYQWATAQDHINHVA